MITRGIKAVVRRPHPKLPKQDALTRPFTGDYKDVKAQLGKQYPMVGSGSYRMTLDYTSRTVLKVPHHKAGERDNIIEAVRYREDPTHKAWCELKRINGVWALRMERVAEMPIDEKFRCPGWVHALTNDGPQAGYRSTGELVVYDYAYIWGNHPLESQFDWLIKHYGKY
jgi:hypothetical protein